MRAPGKECRRNGHAASWQALAKKNSQIIMPQATVIAIADMRRERRSDVFAARVRIATASLLSRRTATARIP
jgi:hypothetical protein